MLVHLTNSLNLLAINKRLIILAVILLAVILFVLSPEIVSAGPATSPSACGTCAG